jgi:hypothetical protein
MTDNEQELLNIIRNHDDPKQAVQIALDLIFDFLKPREEPPGTLSANLPEFA